MVELIGWEGKIGKLQKKLQNAAKTVHTVSGAVGSIAKKEPNVDGLIGAAVIIGKDAVSDTKVGRIADDVINKYGEKLNNELRQNETENKLSVSPVTNVADNRKQQLRRNGRKYRCGSGNKYGKYHRNNRTA